MTSTLKVDQIQNTSGVGGLSIDSSGRVTKSSPVCGYFYPSSEQSISNNTDTTIQITSVGFNEGLTLDETNYRVTVPIDGFYMVALAVTYKSGADRIHAGIKINGGNAASKGLPNPWLQHGDYANSSTHNSQPMARLLKLEANDYLTLHAYHTSGSSFNLHRERTYLSLVQVA